MKTNYILSLIAVAGLTACAMQAKIQSDNPASVTFSIKGKNDSNALTFWRKIDANGKKGRRFSLGQSQAASFMNAGLPEFAPETINLDPGTYYLDSYQASGCVSENTHFMMRNGWDDANNKPLYMSFTVSEGQTLNLPIVEFDFNCKTTITGDTSKIQIGSKFKS
jgi:hypothetical protein